MGWTTYSQPAGLMGFDWNAANNAEMHKQYVASQKPGMMTANPFTQRPAAPEQTLRDRVFGEYQKQLDKANAANESRYSEMKGLYNNLLSQGDAPAASMGGGFGGAVGGQASGFAAPYSSSQSNNLGISLNQWGAGGMDKSGPLWGPQASAAMADYGRRGLGDSTAAFNKQVLGNSMDLANLQQRSIDTGMRQNQIAYQQAADQRDYATNLYNTNRNRRDNLTSQLAGIIGDRNDVAPDMNPLLQLAAQEGQGNTDGMYAPQIDQGGGGMQQIANNLYGGFANSNPMPYFSTRGAYGQTPRWKQQIALQKQAKTINGVGGIAAALT